MKQTDCRRSKPLDTSQPIQTWPATKESHFDEVCNTFAGSGVNVTVDGRPYNYLRAAIASHEYVEEYMSSKVQTWSSASIFLVM